MLCNPPGYVDPSEESRKRISEKDPSVTSFKVAGIVNTLPDSIRYDGVPRASDLCNPLTAEGDVESIRRGIDMACLKIRNYPEVRRVTAKGLTPRNVCVASSILSRISVCPCK